MVYEDVETNGVIKRNFTLIQGDTFAGTISIKKDNVAIPSEDVASLKFKLSDRNYNLIYEKDFTYQDESGKWLIVVPSAKTKEIGVGRYIYEYELTFVTGFVTTIMQANFKITDEISEA